VLLVRKVFKAQQVLREIKVTQDRKVVLDHKALQEAQDFKVKLDLLELREMWETLDRLVPPEQPEM
jgi:hypothetical protein